MKRVTKETLQKALTWFATGNTGLSSTFMCSTLCGIANARYAHPHDPSDLNRCFQMLKAVPELKDRISRMKDASKEWETLIKNWDALESSFINEAGENWSKGRSATITYHAMKSFGL